MTQAVEGFPPELAHVDVQKSAVALTADSSLYPLEAVYGAAYVFIDRCYVLLDRPDPTHVRVVLTTKKTNVDEAQLRAMVGEFANELLSCAWRGQIAQENRLLIESLTTQALSGAMGPPSLEDLASFDFSEETFEDPLGIAMSWEDKYKKKDKSAEAASPEPEKKGETP